MVSVAKVVLCSIYFSYSSALNWINLYITQIYRGEVIHDVSISTETNLNRMSKFRFSGGFVRKPTDISINLLINVRKHHHLQTELLISTAFLANIFFVVMWIPMIIIF